MPNDRQTEQPTEKEWQKEKRASLKAMIRDQVMDALGTPSDLRHVQIRKVWEDHYRVNVIVGATSASVRVANSYFLVIDGKGSVIAATPKITRQY